MAGLPWFKVYAAETLSDEAFQGWDVGERGAWFTLICVAWREGSIPGDQQSLAKLLHLDGSAMRQVWSAIGSRFVDHPDHPGRLTSPRLEREREAAELLRSKKVDAGKSGARSRWDRPKSKHGRAMAVPKQELGSVVANDSDQDRSDQERTEQQQQAAAAHQAPTLDAFREALAARMAVPADWFRLAKAERVAEVREQLTAEVSRLGLARAVDVAAEAATRTSPKPRWLAWFVGALQDASLRPVNSEPYREPWAASARSETWRDEKGRTLAEIRSLPPEEQERIERENVEKARATS